MQILDELVASLRQEMIEMRRRQNINRRAADAPVEILRHIFETVCLPYTDTRHSMVPGEDSDFTCMLRALLKDRQSILSVCSRWRGIALQDSALWDDVLIEYTADRRAPSCKRFLSETALSGDRELSLHLVVDNKSEGMMSPIVDDLLDNLFPRITSLNVSAICARAGDALATQHLETFSALRVLRLGLNLVRDNRTEHMYEEGSFPVLGLGTMHQLRTAVIDCEASYAITTGTVHILSSNPCSITHLVLWSSFTSDFEVLDIFACILAINHCPYLETLDWSTGIIAPGLVHPLDTLLLDCQNHLTELSIAGDVPISLIPNMHYPNLLKLRIHHFHGLDDEKSTETQAYIHGIWTTLDKFPKLRHLDQRVCAHSEHIIPFLHAHPHLEELVLWHDIDATWVDGLTALSAPSTFRLPNLVRVWTNECSGCATGTGTDGSPCSHPSAPYIDELLRRRAVHQSPSQPFTLSLHPDYHGPDVAQLADIYSEDINSAGVRVLEAKYPNTTWYRYDYK